MNHSPRDACAHVFDGNRSTMGDAERRSIAFCYAKRTKANVVKNPTEMSFSLFRSFSLLRNDVFGLDRGEHAWRLCASSVCDLLDKMSRASRSPQDGQSDDYELWWRRKGKYPSMPLTWNEFQFYYVTGLKWNGNGINSSWIFDANEYGNGLIDDCRWENVDCCSWEGRRNGSCCWESIIVLVCEHSTNQLMFEGFRLNIHSNDSRKQGTTAYI